MNEKLYSMIGLSQKAGKITSGEEPCEREIKSGKSQLIIIAQDSSDNTKKRFTQMCNYRNISFIEFGIKEKLGKMIGKEYRAVLSVKDKNFANLIIGLYNQMSSGGE
ncbi:ribosomal L7Ae/L30e/S12e/Gadd45 family protein [Petroclostridium sp. X23]|uniref:L7Ae/L30e/S12e/Gadd45 family ribosomal protein n=1 Tax=Petroclostridium sp. X23 TaxID=3045146 RepID=UPI0024ADE94B|nr:ribosomal L7Ae/L30e/S12e/Gadd45 family protein [Petroclostridium sp. X23]WHH58978.1 ribosomal L7Ae/L30e/S12e/Gadd45 family protein [Petroclostridium sp. X23]